MRHVTRYGIQINLDKHSTQNTTSTTEHVRQLPKQDSGHTTIVTQDSSLEGKTQGNKTTCKKSHVGLTHQDDTDRLPTRWNEELKLSNT